MWQDNEIQIVISAIDEVSARMQKIESVARDTKKRLEKEMVVKLRSDVAVLDLGLKEARKKLAAAKDRDTKLKLTLDTQKLQRELTEVKRRLNNYLNTGDENLSRLQVKFNGIGGSLKNIFGSAWSWAKNIAVGSIGAITKGVVQLGDQLEKAKISFTTMLGSAAKADTLLSQLSDFAKKSPFKLTEVRDNAKQLLAMGISANKIIPTMKALGDLSAALGVEMSRLALNYGQVMSKGKLAGQELKDFTTAGVPLLDELSKNLAKSKTEIQSMISKGQISANEVTRAFETMTSEGGRFADLMSKQSQTLSGMWANFSDSLAQMGEKIGLFLLPGLKESVDWIKRMFDRPDNKYEEEIESLTLKNSEFQKVLEGVKGKINQLNEDFRNGKITAENYGIEYNRLNTMMKITEKDIARTNEQIQEQTEKMAHANQIADEHITLIQELNGKASALQAQLYALKRQYDEGKISEKEYLEQKKKLILEYENLKTKIDQENASTSKQNMILKALEANEISAAEAKKFLTSLQIENSEDLAKLNSEQIATNKLAMSYVELARKKAEAELLEKKTSLENINKSHGEWRGVFASMKDDVFGGKGSLNAIKKLKTEIHDLEKKVSGYKKIEEEGNAFSVKSTPTTAPTIKTKTALGGRASGGGSKFSKTEMLKKSLQKQREMEIKAIQDSLLDEEEKMRSLTQIKEKYEKKKKDIEGKSNDELLKEAEDYMEKLKKGREDNYKDHQKKADDAMKDVKKYTENLDKIKEKFGEIKEKAQESLRSIKNELGELENDHIKALGERYYELKKKLADGGDDAEELRKINEELDYLDGQLTDDQKEKSKKEAEKTESQRLVEKYQEAKKLLEEKKKITEALNSIEEVDGERKLRVEGERVEYRDTEKEKFVEIIDFKNQEYARDLLNQQLKLETEYNTEKKHLEESKKLALDHSKAILKIWENDTELYKKQLKERGDAVRLYVDNVKAMMAEISEAKANAQKASITNNNQVTNSNNRTTNYNITNISSGNSRLSGVVGLK